MRSVGTGLVLAALSTFGCSDMDPGTDTWQLLNGGGNGDDGTGSNWSCLEDPATAEKPEANPNRMITYELPIEDWVDRSPIPGLNILKCATIDGACNMPLAAPITPPDSRTDQVVSVPLEEGFAGFLKFVSADGVTLLPDGTPDVTNAYVPEAYYFGDTVFANRSVQPNIQVLRTPVLLQVAQNINIALDFASAIIVLRVFDCDGEPAAGARFTLNKPGEPYTFQSGLPQTPDDSTDFIPTDAQGQAGFANVAPGFVFADAYVASTGAKINRSTVSATALANQLTVMEIHARPYGVATAQE
jgi:hypothetical protein